MKRRMPLKHYRKYSPDLKGAVCQDREKGLSLRECAKKYNLFRPGCKKPPDSLILGWEKLYKELGPECFFVNRQGNRSQYGSDGEPTSLQAKKRIKELREENEKLKLQVDYLKKLNALVQENQKRERFSK